ncbi:MAG: ATP-binding cassette domain-containing protein [Bacilli bacterium]|nr:ATP-binding cassette domain-containing protein [Bacilli bacterium]
MELVDKNIKFTLDEKEINGLTGTRLDKIIDIIAKSNKKISYVDANCHDKFYEETLEEHLVEYMKVNEIYPKNLNKKIKDSLKIVALDEELLERNIMTLSSSEKKKLLLAKALLKNPDILILKEPFRKLDMRNQKKLSMVLKRIKEKYQKVILIISDNPNTLLKETNHLIIFKNNKILCNDNTMNFYKDVESLKLHKIDIPDIIEITYLANKKKNAKIDYFKDIRDIIKDIYKHV